MLYVGFATLIVSMGVTWAVTPLVIRLAAQLGALDLPGGRKTHESPMPRIGGLAVFLGFLAGLTFAAFATGNLTTFPQPGVYWRGLAFAALALLLVGLIDDLWGLSFYWKFAAQILAATYIWSCGFRIESITHPLGGHLDLGLLSYPLTVLWIVGITNAVNLIDGLDGLAAGTALITSCAMVLIGITAGKLGVTAVSVTLAGSLLGFLRFNFNPARIFLGDSGSLFLDFVLAVTSIRGSQKGPAAVAILVPLLVLGLPLMDTGLAVLRRMHRLVLRGQKTDNLLHYVVRNINHVFLPDRGHIHHLLLDVGMTHRRAVLLLYGVGSLFALAAFALVLTKSLWMGVLLLVVLALAMAGFLGLLYFRVRKLEPPTSNPGAGSNLPPAEGSVPGQG